MVNLKTILVMVVIVALSMSKVILKKCSKDSVCKGFKCNKGKGVCNTQCTSGSKCATGYYCNPKKKKC